MSKSRSNCCENVSTFLKLFFYGMKKDEIKAVGPCTLVIRDTGFHTAKPKGIIAVDFDDTLYEHQQSKISNKIILKNSEQWFSLLTNAKSQNFLIVIVTARSYFNEYSASNYQRVSNALEEFSKSQTIFSAIYYTNYATSIDSHEYKSIALKDLNNKFYNGDAKTRAQIVLCDDQKNFRLEVERHGFAAVDGNLPEKLKPFIQLCENRHHATSRFKRCLTWSYSVEPSELTASSLVK